MAGMFMVSIVQVMPPSLVVISEYVAPEDAPRVSEKVGSADFKVMTVLL